jgi:hypothetical protein
MSAMAADRFAVDDFKRLRRQSAAKFLAVSNATHDCR